MANAAATWHASCPIALIWNAILPCRCSTHARSSRRRDSTIMRYISMSVSGSKCAEERSCIEEWVMSDPQKVAFRTNPFDSSIDRMHKSFQEKLSNLPKRDILNVKLAQLTLK